MYDVNTDTIDTRHGPRRDIMFALCCSVHIPFTCAYTCSCRSLSTTLDFFQRLSKTCIKRRLDARLGLDWTVHSAQHRRYSSFSAFFSSSFLAVKCVSSQLPLRSHTMPIMTSVGNPTSPFFNVSAPSRRARLIGLLVLKL